MEPFEAEAKATQMIDSYGAVEVAKMLVLAEQRVKQLEGLLLDHIINYDRESNWDEDAWHQDVCDAMNDRLAELENHGVFIEYRVSPTHKVLTGVFLERQRQDQKWGGPENDDRKSPFDWCQLIEDYVGWTRVMACMDSTVKYRRRMTQVAALAVAALEAQDRDLDRLAAPPSYNRGVPSC